MARGDFAANALLARIATSANTLTIHFPAARNAAPIVGPAPLPVSPLTGTKPAPTLLAVPETPERDPLTLKCLWLDAPLAERTTGDGRTYAKMLWVEHSTALARVAWEDALVDVEDVTLGTWFDKALYLEHNGLRWRVLKTEPMGAGFRQPHTLSVWLTGANKQ